MGDGKGGVVECPFELERHYNLAGRAAKALPDVRDGREEQVGIGLVELAVVFEGKTLVDGAVLDVYIVNVGVVVGLVIGYAEHIYVGNGMAYHLAAAHETLQEQVALLDNLCPLKLQLLRQGLHLLIQQLAELAGVALEYFAGLAYVFHVVVVALAPYAGAVAVVYVVL